MPHTVAFHDGEAYTLSTASRPSPASSLVSASERTLTHHGRCGPLRQGALMSAWRPARWPPSPFATEALHFVVALNAEDRPK